MTELLVRETENLVMDSLEISKLTNKEHGHIRRDIENMLEELELDVSKFGYTYFDSLNREQEKYNLTKDLTLTLISGYNVKLRKAIIDRWLELESIKPLTFEEMAKQTIYLADKRILALENKIKEDKPITDFGRAISQSVGTVLIGDWIKTINDSGDISIGRNKAFKWFRDKGYLTQNNRPMQQYINQGLMELKEGMITTDVRTIQTFTTVLTGKGQIYFAGKLKEYFI